MLKIAIVGCGKISDAHATQIGLIPGCKLVAVCDREGLMARQFAERFDVAQEFTDVDELLRVARPDVVHITTPPQSHYPLAKKVLQAGCHAYVEKPFTLRATEAEELVALATASNLKVTVGHDEQFRAAGRDMRALVKTGYLGGPPVHLECTYTYDLSDPTYAKALLSDPNHWALALPGQLLHNVISHGVSKISEFFDGSNVRVRAVGFMSPFLTGLGGRHIVDELRTVIVNDRGQTAHFNFSSQLRPELNELRIYGPRNGLLVDYSRNSVIKCRGKRYKSYLESLLPAVDLGRQYLSVASRNLRRIIACELPWEGGKRHLIQGLYESAASGTPPPIPYSELLLTAKIMDEIFAQLKPNENTLP